MSAGDLAVTVTPGNTAPWASVTDPVNRPWSICAIAGVATAPATASAKTRLLCHFMKPSSKGAVTDSIHLVKHAVPNDETRKATCDETPKASRLTGGPCSQSQVDKKSEIKDGPLIDW